MDGSIDIPAGAWHLIGDGIILAPCDVQFDVLTRGAQGDQPLASWSHHFDPPASGFDAQPFEGDAQGVAASAKSGDRLILRITVLNVPAGSTFFYIPNGDGAGSNGRIPSLTPPR